MLNAASSQPHPPPHPVMKTITGEPMAIATVITCARHSQRCALVFKSTIRDSRSARERRVLLMRQPPYSTAATDAIQPSARQAYFLGMLGRLSSTLSHFPAVKSIQGHLTPRHARQRSIPAKRKSIGVSAGNRMPPRLSLHNSPPPSGRGRTKGFLSLPKHAEKANSPAIARKRPSKPSQPKTARNRAESTGRSTESASRGNRHRSHKRHGCCIGHILPLP